MKENLTDNKFFLKLLFLSVSFLGIILVIVGLRSKVDLKNKNLGSEQKQVEISQTGGGTTSRVLGERTPQIYVSGGREGYGSGGMIALASTDEPSVKIGGYDISGSVEVSVYQANEDLLLDYLTHDKDGKQIKKNPDISALQLVTKVDHPITSGYGEGSKLLLPIGESGIWLLRIKYGSVEEDSFVIRSNFGVISKQGDNEVIFWGQNFKTKKSISEGTIKIYNLQDSRQEIATANFGSEGITKIPVSIDADIAFVQIGDDRVVVPINLHYLNTGYSYKHFRPKERQTKYFTFTDRPIYRPGDTIYFKSVLRDDDDARYTIPSGQAKVKIYSGWNEEDVIFDKDYSISSHGTVTGDFKLPENSKTGDYHLTVSIPGSTQSSTYFNVEFYRKPEYSIEISVVNTELIAGDKSSFSINGSYFSGQPLANQKVKYRVYSGDFYEYDYILDKQYALESDYRWGYWGGSIISEGEATFDKKGTANVDLEAKIPQDKKRSQVYSIEAEFDDGSGNPAFSRKNILVYAGEYGIYRKDGSSYSAKVNTQLSLSVTLVPYRNTSVSGISLTAKVKRENWISYQEADKKYLSWRKEEEELPLISARTDSQGNAVFSFMPTKTGSYNFTVESKDGRGNTILKNFYSYVSSEEQPYYSGDKSGLNIQTDKPSYLPSDTARLTITSAVPDRDVFLSLERGRVNRFQIVHLTGKTGDVDIPLVETDIPNIYAKVSSFSNDSLEDATVNVPVSKDSKKLVVNITPNSKVFGPSENITVNVETKDIKGNPVSADLALWAVDKAIFELVYDRPEKIFDTFWSERYDATQQSHSLEGIIAYMAEGGGCFGKGTLVLMSDGRTKPIEEVKAGDYVLAKESPNNNGLVKARVKNLHKQVVSGVLIINGNLKVTPNHRLWVNEGWKEAGSIQAGDLLLTSKGNFVEVTSLEWLRGRFEVYNLEIEEYKTYFANTVWVHNQKGGGGRAIFKDTAYWNPSIQTDSSGRAQIVFKLPDNLTTWVIAAVGSTFETKVGQTTNEVVVTKDVIVRPILPNIFREGDEAAISALVQNFTENDQTFEIGLKFDAGNVKPETKSDVLVKAKEMQQVYWNIYPKIEKERAKLTFSAISKDNQKVSDAITQEIPVRPFGFWEQKAETGDGEKTFSVKLAQDAHKEKSGIKLSLSSTILGTLPTAMEYLVNYPYGCVEQTTSRFVPAVIAKSNQDIFAEALKDKDIDDILQKGLRKLANLQKGDGGWTWWYTGNSDPFITAYVVEYLLQAQESGVKVDKEMLSRAKSYLERQDQQTSKEDIVAKNYALTLLNSDKRRVKLDDLDGLSPDLLALAVISNFLNGDKNSASNGLNKLVGMAKAQGDALFWETGNKKNFASEDASTAWAIRAIVIANGEREIAVKGARYLTRNRRSNYWSNTYGTAQVIRALVDLSKTGEELTPNYTYVVTVDNKEIARGTVISSRQIIKDIVIPTKEVKQNGSSISLSKSGEGQIYSTLVINEFHTDRKAKSKNNGLEVLREYINDKGEEYSLAVGDMVTVRITISGLKANENYGIIADELPAGLIPVNPSLKSEQFNQDPNAFYSYYGVTDREVTENGMILSLYQIASGTQTYSYKARVVSEGIYTVPPVSASLMYAPEVNGRSEVQAIKITKEHQILPGKLVKKRGMGVLPIIVAVVVIISGSILIILRKRRRNNSQPPISPDQGGSNNSSLHQ